MCLSGGKTDVNSVCILKMNAKHDLLTISASRGQIRNSAMPLMSRASSY